MIQKAAGVMIGWTIYTHRFLSVFIVCGSHNHLTQVQIQHPTIRQTSFTKKRRNETQITIPQLYNDFPQFIVFHRRNHETNIQEVVHTLVVFVCTLISWNTRNRLNGNLYVWYSKEKNSFPLPKKTFIKSKSKYHPRTLYIECVFQAFLVL